MTKDRLYVAELVGGPSQLRVFDHDGKPVATPAILPVSSVSGLTATGDDVLFENQSYLEPPAWYRAGPDGKVSRTALVRKSPVSFADTEVVPRPRCPATARASP